MKHMLSHSGDLPVKVGQRLAKTLHSKGASHCRGLGTETKTAHGKNKKLHTETYYYSSTCADAHNGV